nr:unnamed protein product [Digitaria exilis]
MNAPASSIDSSDCLLQFPFAQEQNQRIHHSQRNEYEGEIGEEAGAEEELCWRRGGSLPPLLLLPVRCGSSSSSLPRQARADCRACRCQASSTRHEG